MEQERSDFTQESSNPETNGVTDLYLLRTVATLLFRMTVAALVFRMTVAALLFRMTVAALLFRIMVAKYLRLLDSLCFLAFAAC